MPTATAADAPSAVNHVLNNFMSGYFNDEFHRLPANGGQANPNGAAEELEMRLIELWYVMANARELVGEIPGADAGAADRVMCLLHAGMALLAATGPAVEIMRREIFRAAASGRPRAAKEGRQ